jgi:hypothetical protein
VVATAGEDLGDTRRHDSRPDDADLMNVVGHPDTVVTNQ